MTEHGLRRALPEDIPALSALWKKVFGDSDEYISAFYAALPSLGAAVAAECDGVVCGMAHALMCSLYPGGTKCAYIYAVAVDERFRHRGLGAALTCAAAELGRELGAETICTEPAEPSLYSWYERILSAKPALRRSRRAIPAVQGEAEKISAYEYGVLRERLLRGKLHIVLPHEWLELQGVLFEEMGGAYFRHGDDICAAFPLDGRCLIQELLGGDSLASAVCAEMGLNEAEIFYDCADGEPYMACTVPALLSGAIWSLTLDTVE